MENAYDSLDWDFFMSTLRAFYFPSQFITLIMNCVSTASIRIRYNGYCTAPFSPSGGIRQGDPMSPILFNLCMSMFAGLIRQASLSGMWLPLYYNNSDMTISHMSFADDVVIFGETSLPNIKSMLAVVGRSFLCSCQRINYRKSQVVCANNLDPRIARFLFHRKGFCQASPDIMYLGYPFIKNDRCAAQLHCACTKLTAKLGNSKYRMLSQAGQLVLIKSILFTLPVYWMSCYRFPKSIIRKLQ